jgi:hypothetical protein
MNINTKVTTPNGPGIYQHMLYKDGQTLVMVAHSVTAHIDQTKAEILFGIPGQGIWLLAGYTLDQVQEA